MSQNDSAANEREEYAIYQFVISIPRGFEPGMEGDDIIAGAIASAEAHLRSLLGDPYEVRVDD